MLSGSPIQNNIDEFISMLKFVNPKEGERFNEEIKSSPVAQKEALLGRLSNVVLRRLIKDTIKSELPPTHSVTMFLKLQETQKKLFDAIIKEEDTTSKMSNVFLYQELISWILVHPGVM